MTTNKVGLEDLKSAVSGTVAPGVAAVASDAPDVIKYEKKQATRRRGNVALYYKAIVP